MLNTDKAALLKREYIKNTRDEKISSRVTKLVAFKKALAIFVFLCFCLSSIARADDDVLPTLIQAQINIPLAKVGSGTYRKFGFSVYQATLWAPNGQWDATKPYALEWSYTRSLSKETLADSIIDNIHDENIADDATFARWSEGIKSTMPAVEDGDVMIGVVNPGVETLLYLNGNPIAQTKDEALTNAFFNVWLGDGANENLKRALLGQSE